MIHDDPTPPAPSLAVIIITAAATAFATALATWAVDELRAKYGTAPAKPEPTKEVTGS